MVADAMQLHEEFPVETTFLVDFMQMTIHAVKNNFNYNKETWVRESMILDFNVWAEFIDTIDERIKDYKLIFKEDAATFGRLLFGDGNRVFTLHCLYALANAIPENEKFNNKVLQLFY